MQKNLSRLARELQKETCPQWVHDEVQRRIAAQTPSRGWLRLAIPAVATVLVAVCCVLIWQSREREKARQEAALAERLQIAHQTENALGLIGRVLVDAGAQSGKVIYDRAAPPLRNSLQTANNKIIHDIEL